MSYESKNDISVPINWPLKIKPRKGHLRKLLCHELFNKLEPDAFKVLLVSLFNDINATVAVEVWQRGKEQKKQDLIVPRFNDEFLLAPWPFSIVSDVCFLARRS